MKSSQCRSLVLGFTLLLATLLLAACGPGFLSSLGGGGSGGGATSSPKLVVTDVSPADGETGVEVTAQWVIITFNRPIDASTVDEDSVQLTFKDGRVVESTISVNDKQVRIIPTERLDLLAPHCVIVSTRVASENGLKLDSGFESSFFTRPGKWGLLSQTNTGTGKLVGAEGGQGNGVFAFSLHTNAPSNQVTVYELGMDENWSPGSLIYDPSEDIWPTQSMVDVNALGFGIAALHVDNDMLVSVVSPGETSWSGVVAINQQFPAESLHAIHAGVGWHAVAWQQGFCAFAGLYVDGEGPISPEECLNSDVVFQCASAPSMTQTTDQEYLFVWVENTLADPPYSLWTRSVELDQSVAEWDEPRLVLEAVNDREISDPALAVAGDYVLLVWEEEGEIWSQRSQRPFTAWQDLLRVDVGNDILCDCSKQPVVESNGDVVVVTFVSLEQVTPFPIEVTFARVFDGTSEKWSEVVQLESDSQQFYDSRNARSVIDTGGNAWLAWDQESGNERRIVTQAWFRDTGWQEPQAIPYPVNPLDASNPFLGILPDGRAAIVIEEATSQEWFSILD